MEITLKDLYKVMSSNDKEILSHFEDTKYNDREYFFAALNSDIFSSAIDLLNNLEAGNEDSPGVDVDCRKIIEAFTLLKMLDDISDEQISFFRNQYLLVEYENLEAIIKKMDKSEGLDLFLSKRKEYIEKLSKFYNVSFKELREHYAEDPCFFLKKTINDRTSFPKLIEKYNVFNENKVPMYEFFSIFSHPHHFESEQLIHDLKWIRKGFIDHLLDMVILYIKDLKLWVMDCKEKTFGELFYQDCLKEQRIEINSFDVFFNEVIDKTKLIQGTEDCYIITFLNTLRSIIKDMLVAETLGYNEHCIEKFKIFAEFVGVDFSINISESQSEFVIKKAMYNISSVLSISNCLGAKENAIRSQSADLHIAYDKFYKKAYNLSNYKEFENNVINNSLYFILNSKKSYKKVVRKMASEILYDDEFKTEFMTLFQIANDYAHAGGHCFNSSPGITEITPHQMIVAICKYLLILILNMETVQKDKGKDIEFSDEIKFLRNIIAGESKAAEDIALKYKNLFDKQK